MDIGSALGRELGLPETKIAAVVDWRATTVLDDVEKLVLELAEALTATPVTVDEELRRRLHRRFTQRQLVELANPIAWENCRARFNRCFDIQPDGYNPG